LIELKTLIAYGNISDITPLCRLTKLETLKIVTSSLNAIYVEKHRVSL